MAYTVLSEIQTQETDLAGDQVDVVAVRASSPVTLPTGAIVNRVFEVRVPLATGWDTAAIAYLNQRVAEMDQVAPTLATVVAQSQVQEVGVVGDLIDVMQVSFETSPELFVGAVRVPLASGWPDVASQAIDQLATQMQNVVAGG
jgi:hypothetical protein